MGINNSQHASMINLLERRYHECKEDRNAIHEELKLNDEQHRIYASLLNIN